MNCPTRPDTIGTPAIAQGNRPTSIRLLAEEPPMTDQPTDPPMNPLQRLIRSRMLEMRCSYGDIARRGGLPRSTVHYVATHNHPARLPHPATLERLAVGLDLPVGVLRAAAASAAGPALLPEHVC